jgi:hypothetical protein
MLIVIQNILHVNADEASMAEECEGHRKKKGIYMDAP